MGLVVAATFGFLLWIVLWATGQKAIDAFLVTVVILLVAATVRMVTRQFGDRTS